VLLQTYIYRTGLDIYAARYGLTASFLNSGSTAKFDELLYQLDGVVFASTTSVQILQAAPADVLRQISFRIPGGTVAPVTGQFAQQMMRRS
jgi:hypothetical protein